MTESHPTPRQKKATRKVFGRLASPLAAALALIALAAGRTDSCHHGADAALGDAAGKFEEPAEKLVRIIPRREGDTTRFFVENRELAEVTVTFNLALLNLEGDVRFPHTATFPPQQTSEAFTLSPVDPADLWQYSYTNYYKVGSNGVEHDDAYAYRLPYAPGESFRITQGYNGRYSHRGPNRYAIDWRMPEGTPVHAARGGLVVKVKDDGERGGPSREYDRHNNYIMIRHEDGTIGHYCHLQHRGAKVKEGDVVHSGDLIALSGNTGYSSGPHLHFAVFKTRDGRQRQTIPIKFRTGDASATSLRAGRSYRAL